MAPIKNGRNNNKQSETASIAANSSLPLACKGCTRYAIQNSQNCQNENTNNGILQTRTKRKAEHSPFKNEKVKRTALDNVTNNVNNQISTTHFAEDVKSKKKSNITQSNNGTSIQKQIQKSTNVPLQKHAHTRITTRATTRLLSNTLSNIAEDQTNDKPKGNNCDADIIANANSCIKQNSNKTKVILTDGEVKTEEETHKCKPNNLEVANDVFIITEKQNVIKLGNAPFAPAVALEQQEQQNQHHQKVSVNKPGRRISNEFSEESVYISAVEDISSDTSRLSGNFETLRRRSSILQKLNEQNTVPLIKENYVVSDTGDKFKVVNPPKGVEDFDKANWDDPFQVSHYARDIFNYLKERESLYPIDDYMSRQVHLSKWMRALLVDWMVEVQETFELFHETLYLAVKIVDLYLCKTIIHKDKLQLLGAAALFIACKYDERSPPLIEDFLYICDGAYFCKEMLSMEMNALRTIGYDLGMPLSYRFLRRYARCGKVPIVTLTLARYILELSLMDYETVTLSDSKRAAAALFIALRLRGDKCGWNATLEYHSGYVLEDFFDIVPILNAGMHSKPKSNIKRIKSKYSHKIFHEVAKIPPMANSELFNIEIPTDENFSDDSQYSSTIGILMESSFKKNSN